MTSGIKRSLVILSLLLSITTLAQQINKLKPISLNTLENTIKTLSEQPIVIGSAILNNDISEIILRGEVTDLRDAIINEKGFVYSTTTDIPTILDSKILVETNEEVFTNILSDLLPDTLYYIRSYLTTTKGVIYSSLNIIDTSTLSNIDVNLKANLKTYPNPSTNYISLAGLKETRNYTIYNMTGKELVRGTVSINNKIDVRSLDKGLYLLKLKGIEMVKFIKV